jgi:hypothetical protein
MMLEHLVGPESGAAVERPLQACSRRESPHSRFGQPKTSETRFWAGSEPYKTFPGVLVSTCHVPRVEAAAVNFVRRTDSFDVVVASNLFGDIFSESRRS